MIEKEAVNVILVEDNADLREELIFQWQISKINVTGVAVGMQLDQYMQNHHYDIAVVDIGRPGENGLSIAQRFRQSHSNMGIIMLTAQDAIDTRLEGFSSGADIYLVKPVDTRELAAQIAALHRRLNTTNKSLQVNNAWYLLFGGREIISPNKHTISLTHMEGQLMIILAKHAGKTVSREMLIQQISPEETNSFDPRRLEVCISRLRQKLLSSLSIEGSNDAQQPIKTVRAKGYAFTQLITIENS